MKIFIAKLLLTAYHSTVLICRKRKKYVAAGRIENMVSKSYGTISNALEEALTLRARKNVSRSSKLRFQRRTHGTTKPK